MKYCSDSGVRKDFYEARNKFWSEWEYNNRTIILKLLELREEKAILLGFKNYGELSLKFKMADSPEHVVELFSDIAQKAKPKAETELKEITKHFNLSDISVWDMSYYGRKLREEKYALDDRELKKYFVYENVLSGMFITIQKLYGIEMKKITRESYHEDVEIYEVYKDGKFLSYFFTDYFYRTLKRQGAWANILRENYAENTKITVNVCNFQRVKGEPTLLTLSDVETMFHEFGHATHEMLSKSKYSELSGFHVEWDFVELPSQLLENWCRDRDGMKLFAKHVDSWNDIPEEMFEKLELLDTFGNGQMILKQNEYAMMDMWLHMWNIPGSEEELDARIYENYEINAMFPRGDIYSPHTSFSHIFDGWYAAWYYSYMWAEIIEKEVWKAFKDSGNIFSPEVAKDFYDKILSAGTTKKASELFRDFFWRDVEIDAFLKEKGLV
jgi:peptidyl-dipeptidase Dcp